MCLFEYLFKKKKKKEKIKETKKERNSFLFLILQFSKRDLEAEAAYDVFLEESKKKREESKRAKYDSNPNARRNVKKVAFSEDGKRA